MKEIIVSENEAGKRLDRLLMQYLSEASSGFLYKMLRKKNITLNGKKANGTEKLVYGDVIKIFLAEDTICKFGNQMLKSAFQSGGEAEQIKPFQDAFQNLHGIEVLYENQQVVIVNKPVGILSQKAEIQDFSLNEWLIGYLIQNGKLSPESLLTYRPSVCNRIDRNTSGIVICAKTLLGAQKMSQMLKDRTIGKYYRTIAVGIIDEASHIHARIFKNEKNNTVKILPWKEDGAGDPIETAYQPISVNHKDKLTYLEVELLTGKTHQIRAQLASMGHPLLGDFKYGEAKINEKYRSEYGIRSQLLHSYRLQFPIMEDLFADLSQKEIIAPIPELMNRLIRDKFHKE